VLCKKVDQRKGLCKHKWGKGKLAGVRKFISGEKKKQGPLNRPSEREIKMGITGSRGIKIQESQIGDVEVKVINVGRGRERGGC